MKKCSPEMNYNNYEDDVDDGEDNDLESAAVAQRLIRTSSPGVFQPAAGCSMIVVFIVTV